MLCGNNTVYTVCAVSEGVLVSLTPNVSPISGKFCPTDMVELTCRTSNVPGTSLRWFHDSSVGILELLYLYSAEDGFPLPRNVSSAEGFISYTIVSATLDEDDRSIVNFTAEVVIDLDVLFTVGYRSLQCGSIDEKANFSLDLDIEGVGELLIIL